MKPETRQLLAAMKYLADYRPREFRIKHAGSLWTLLKHEMVESSDGERWSEWNVAQTVELQSR